MTKKQILGALSILSAVVAGLMLCGTEFTTLFDSVVSGKIEAGLAIENAGLVAVNGVVHFTGAGD